MANMDESCLTTNSGSEPSSPAEAPHGERWRRAREILTVQRTHLDRLELQLTEQLQQLAEEVTQSELLLDSQESSTIATLRGQFEALQQHFDAVRAECDEARRQFEQSLLERGKLEQELRVRDALLKDVQASDEQRRVELAAAGRQLADVQSQLSALQSRQQNLERELAAEREQAHVAEEQTRAQRRRIAREFEQRRAERLAEYDQRKAELQLLAGSKNTQLTAQLAAVPAEVVEQSTRLEQLQATLDAREQELQRICSQAKSNETDAADKASHLENLRAELNAREQELQCIRSEAKLQEANAADQFSQLEQLQATLNTREQELQRFRSDAKLQEANAAEQFSQLEQLQATLKTREQELQRIRNQATSQEADAAGTCNQLEQVQATLEARELELQQTRSLAMAHQADVEKLQDALADLQRAHDLQLEQQSTMVAADSTASAGELDALLDKCDTLREERDGLAKKLAAAEAQLAQSSKASEGDSRKKEDMQRRFEMAVEEVRDLKRANAELENKLKSRGPVAPTIPGGGLDWEAQKQKLLASLQADDDDDESNYTASERIELEGTIRITDQVVAQKDQEIAELKRTLEMLGGSSAAEKATAMSELFDRDDVICKEREKLIAAQAEWREKIGQAEIDISVQRAKIARERSELEEKLRQLQSEQEIRGSSSEPTDNSKPARGRWLARLGLKDIDDAK